MLKEGLSLKLPFHQKNDWGIPSILVWVCESTDVFRI